MTVINLIQDNDGDIVWQGKTEYTEWKVVAERLDNGCRFYRLWTRCTDASCWHIQPAEPLAWTRYQSGSNKRPAALELARNMIGLERWLIAKDGKPTFYANV